MSKTNDKLGKKVTLRGIAQNAKGGAVIVTENQDVVYIKNLHEWTEEHVSQKVTIIGRLKREKYIPDPHVSEDGAISQGAHGLQLVLEDHQLLNPN